jgi:hyaluronoglucosaminidase
VTPINTATDKAGKAIKVGREPDAMAITPNGKTAYAVNDASGTVTPINIANNKASKVIMVGRGPYAMAIMP